MMGLLRLVLPVGVIVVVVILIMANVGEVPTPPTTLPILAGTRFTIILSRQEDTIFPVAADGEFTVHFDTSSVATLVGAWTSDGPVGTAVFWANRTNVDGMSETGAMGCSLTYNVTLAPGSYSMEIASIQPEPHMVNWTVTQTIQLVPPVGNPTPVSRWEGQAVPCS